MMLFGVDNVRELVAAGDDVGEVAGGFVSGSSPLRLRSNQDIHSEHVTVGVVICGQKMSIPPHGLE